jgi:hypothetical protein
MKLRPLIAPASLLLVASCTDRATFVTSTDIGLQANANTEQIHLGYSRTELFQGPAYPKNGAVPEAVGYLGSNLEIFSPKIIQVYATGEAADLATQPVAPPQTTEDPDPIGGAPAPLVFVTESNIGLKLGFTGTTPSSIKFGFDRQELSIIPLNPDNAQAGAAADGSTKKDYYASVLATVNMDLTTPTATGSGGSTTPTSGFGATGLAVTQFFATGSAARNLAKTDLIRTQILKIGSNQVQAAASASTQALLQTLASNRNANDSAVQAYFAKCSSSYPNAQLQLITKLKATPALPLTAQTDLTKAKTSDEFVKQLNLYGLEDTAAAQVQGLPCSSSS